MSSKKREFLTDKEENFERPIPEDIYPAIDTDLARDNLENHFPTADLEDLL